MKLSIQSHGSSLTIQPEGQRSITVPHIANGPAVVLELVSTPSGPRLRVAVDEPEETGLRVIVRARLDWPQLGFELEQGISHADSLDAWVASVPEAVRAKLAPFVRSADVRLLDLGSNPVVDVGDQAAQLLEAAAS